MKQLNSFLFLCFFLSIFSTNSLRAQTAPQAAPQAVSEDTLVANAYRESKALLNVSNKDEESFKVLNNAFKTHKAAFEKNADACCFLATHYWLGIGTITNDEKAFEFMSKAAALGDPYSICTVGSFYALGTGVKQNPKEGLKWTKMAAAKKYMPAVVRLANYYMEGSLVKRDPKTAIKYLREAAEEEEPSAYYYLAEAFMAGEGVTRDSYEAFKLYLKAANKKERNAYSEVAICYLKGLGVDSDMTKACEWAQKAIEENTAGGMFFSAICYRDGLCGKTKNLAKYNKLIGQANSLGDKHARSLLAAQREEEEQREQAIAAKERAAQEREDAIRLEEMRQRYEGTGGVSNQPTTMEGLVSYLKKTAPSQGYRSIREEARIEAGGKYSYDFGISNEIMVVLIIPYVVTNRSPSIAARHYDFRGENDYSYKSDFSNITQYNNMTMIKMSFSAPLSGGKKFEFKATDSGYFMILSN